MTTIIARPGLLMADTLYTYPDGSQYRSKIFTGTAAPFDKGLWAGSGDDAILPTFRHLQKNKGVQCVDMLAMKLLKVGKEHEFDSSFVWVLPDCVWLLDTDGNAVRYTDWVVLGSGGCFAKSYLAMEQWSGEDDNHKALAELAMKAAFHLDPHTGGKVECFSVET